MKKLGRLSFNRESLLGIRAEDFVASQAFTDQEVSVEGDCSLKMGVA